ncbi:MAG: VWA domain-containing protein [Planctomycetota bacterium]|jgi:hypothetical protein
MHVLAGLALLFCDVADETYLTDRLERLAEAYESQARRQSPEAVGLRVGVLREIGHLPWEGSSRAAAAAFLADVVGNDRSYRVRADACRAIGRVGTPQALNAMYRALFGQAGRSPRYALLYSVVPESLAHLKSAKDWEWLRANVIAPSRKQQPAGLVHLAAHRARSMLIVTLDAAGRAQRIELEEAIRPFASHNDAEVRYAALRALGRMSRSPDLAQVGLRDSEILVRMAAARARSLPPIQIQRALADTSPSVRRMALRNIADRAPEVALPILIKHFQGERSIHAKLDITRILEEQTGREFGMDPAQWSNWWGAQRRRDGAALRTKETRTGARRVMHAGSILFLIDASASMNRLGIDGRSRQQHAIDAIRAVIAAAPRRTRYAVIAFASELRRLPSNGASVQAGKVLPWVDALKPAGASNSYAALMRGVRDPIHPDTIVFMSDGVPRHCSWKGKTYSEPEQILHEVRRDNRVPMVRIHTVGLLGGVQRGDEILDEESAIGFLRRLAAEHEGTYRELR